MTVFCISMILMVVILFTCLSREYVQKRITFNTLVTRALAGMLGISFLSVFVLWYFASEETLAETGRPGIFPAIVYTVQMYSLDTNVDFFADLTRHAGTAASSLIGILMVINPVLLLGTISRLILGEILRIGVNRNIARGDLYIFPFHDEKAVYLAASILKDAENKRHILFTALAPDSDECRSVRMDLMNGSARQVSFAEEPVTELLRRLKKNGKRSLTIFLTEANYDLYEVLLDELYDTDTKIYFFADELQAMTVDRIRKKVDERKETADRKEAVHIQSYCINPVKDSIWRLFLSLIKEEDSERNLFCNLPQKEIHVSIAGWTPYGLELMKTMMWLGTIYGHTAYIHMYHEGTDEELRDLFLYHFPAFSRLDEKPMTYEYHCIGNTLIAKDLFTVELDPVPSLQSDAMVRQILQDRSLITAFMLENDTDNIHLLQKYMQRCDLNRRQYLFIHCEDEDVADYARDMEYAGNFKEGEAVDRNVSLSFIGIPKEFYSLDTIEDTELEQVSIDTHFEERRIKAELDHEEFRKTREDSAKEYWSSEYNRRSSIASALHKKASIRSIPADLARDPIKDSRPLIVVEHDRWSAYMISLGYIPARRDPAERDPYANTIKPIGRHTDIVPYEELPENVKQWDNVTYIMDHVDETVKDYLQKLEDAYKEVHP